MVIVDCQGILESAVIRESKDLVDTRDQQALKALAAILDYLDSLEKLDYLVTRAYQASLDIRVSRGTLANSDTQVILDKLVYRDIPGIKVSVAIQESLVYPDTVALKVLVDTLD